MPIVSRPRTVGTLPVSSCFRFSPLVCFFKAGLLLHLECVSIGKLIAIPPGDRPSHSISVNHLESAVVFLSRARKQEVLRFFSTLLNLFEQVAHLFALGFKVTAPRFVRRGN